MTLPLFRQLVRTQPFLLAFCILLGLAAGVAYAVRAANVYTSTSQVFITVENDDNDTTAQNEGLLYVQERMPTYQRIVTSLPVMNAVRSRVSFETDPTKLAAMIHVTQPADTSLLDLEARADTPSHARDLADATAAAVAAQLPRMEQPSSASDPVLRVIDSRSALVEEVPLTPNRGIDLVLGLLSGLAFGLALTAARRGLESSVRLLEELESMFGSSLLGAVPNEDPPNLRHHVLLHGRWAESLRTIRSNVQSLSPDLTADQAPRMIMVSSPTSRDGKTTIATNLATTLALTGARVLLVDANLRSPEVGTLLGVGDAAGLSAVLADLFDPHEVILTHVPSGLDVLPAGPVPANAAELLSSGRAADVFAELRRDWDYVIVDTPSLEVTDAAVLARLVDAVLLVVRHGRTRKASLASALQAIRVVGGAPTGGVFNAVPSALLAETIQTVAAGPAHAH